MTHFHIVHFIPTERHHGLYGYNEVIETLTWGLNQLGHTVSYAKNQVAYGERNIVFGHQMAGWETLSSLPPGTIIYNMEQYHKLAFKDEGKEVFTFMVKRFEMWDYSEDNIILWNKYGPSWPVSKVPIAYAPILSRIPQVEDQDVDVLIYGQPSGNRVEVMRQLAAMGLKVMFLFGFYGKARDEMIARAKIVLNIGQYDRTFEIVRVSYLLANRKAVVADLYPDISIERDMAEAVQFANLDMIAPACLMLLNNDQARHDLENRGYEAFKRRDIVSILNAAFSYQMVVNTAPPVVPEPEPEPEQEPEGVAE